MKSNQTAICVAECELRLSVDLYGRCASWYVTEIACLATKPADPFDHARLPYWTHRRAGLAFSAEPLSLQTVYVSVFAGVLTLR